MTTGFHGKSLEEIVDIKCKEYFMRKDKERREREELRLAREAELAANKQDVTKPAEKTAPKVEPFLQKWKHKLHLD